MTNSIYVITAIVIYMIGMLAIGFLSSKKNNSSEDFYLGGRKMGPFVVAMSAEASDMSSWLLMGLPGVAYLTGVCDAAWTAIGLAVGTWLNWFFISRRLRRYSCNLGAITIPDYFAKRFHDKNNIITAIAALVIIVFFIPYTASGFAACGKLFNSLFGVDYEVAMIIFACIIIGYTILGGFTAVCTTDFIQSIVMSIALVVVVCFGVSQAGGFANVMDNAKSLPGYLSLTATYNAETSSSVSYGPLAILSTSAWGLGYFGMPHILVRFMSIKDEKKLILSRRIASIWVVIAMSVGLFIGIVGLGMVKAGAIDPLSDPETIIMAITALLSKHSIFAALIGGVILSGILAATMSTADSQLLAAASSISQNIFKDFLHINLSQKVELIVARVTIIAVSLVAIFLARDPNSSVFQIVSFAWAGFGGAFGAPVLCSLFWKRSNLAGAIAGMISGGVAIFVWKYAVRPIGGAWDIYELLPAFLISLIVMVVVSLLTKAPGDDIQNEFEAAKSNK